MSRRKRSHRAQARKARKRLQDRMDSLTVSRTGMRIDVMPTKIHDLESRTAQRQRRNVARALRRGDYDAAMDV